MLRHLLISAAVLCLSVASCTRAEALPASGNESRKQEGGLRFAICVEPQTKAVLDGLDLYFQEGDKVDINDVIYTVTRTEGGEIVVDGVTESPTGRYSCVFPAEGNFLTHPSDKNYKFPPVQYYVKGGIGRDALPMVCDATFGKDDARVLNFTPVMGVVKLPVKADASIRTIKFENNAFDPSNGYTYMSGRCIVKDGAMDMSSDVSTAQCPAVTLLCNGPDGKGAQVAGSEDFYIVLPPRVYSRGFTVTITDNSHRSASYSTAGASTVTPGGLLKMSLITYAPPSDQIFSENFDSCVWGGDPVAYRAGWKGWRGFTPRRSSGQSGVFATGESQGLERPVYYGAATAGTDVTPGSDVWSVWHTRTTSKVDTVYTMGDIPTRIMSEAYIRSRGMWDWCSQKVLEYQGYILVGKSAAIKSGFAGLSESGSPQGAVKTPPLSLLEGTQNVVLKFKIVRGAGTSTQDFRLDCLGGGRIVAFKAGDLTTAVMGNYALIKDVSSIPDKQWLEVEASVAGATPSTHFLMMMPDGTDKAKTATFFLDDVLVRKTGDLSEYANLTGHVTCDGVPVAGVAVSDGYSVVRTDADGKYAIITNPDAEYVRMSIPSGYEAQRAEGDILAKYYASIDPAAEQVVDFSLKAVDQSRFTLFVMADSHVLNGGWAYNANDDRAQFTGTFIPAARELFASEKGPVYGIHVGDMTQCGYWSKYSLSQYYSDSKALDIPVFHAIGNHEHEKGAENHGTFESTLGPRYYSFNVGKYHVVALDNVTSRNGETDNTQTVSPEQMSWLREDISAMSPSVKEIIVFCHCPVLSRTGSSYSMDATSGAELFSVLKGYPVTIFSGHNHYDRTSKGTRGGKTVVDYTHPALCGVGWLGRLADDGTPRSAGVYRYNGATLVRTLYAFDTRTESGHEKIYNRGVHENTGKTRLSESDAPGEAKAILVNYPNAHSCNFLESTGGVGETKLVTDVYDLDFRHFYATFNVSGKKLGDWQAPTAPGHIWRYTPKDPAATITIYARDAMGNIISTAGGKDLTTKIEQ